MSKKLLIGAAITALVGGIATTVALFCNKKEEEEDQNEDYGSWPDFSNEASEENVADEQEEQTEESSTITEKEIEDLQTVAAQMEPSPAIDTPTPSSEPEVPADLVKPPKKRTPKKTEETTE